MNFLYSPLKVGYEKVTKYQAKSQKNICSFHLDKNILIFDHFKQVTSFPVYLIHINLKFFLHSGAPDWLELSIMYLRI